MVQAVEILPNGRQGPVYRSNLGNTMAAYGWATELSLLCTEISCALSCVFRAMTVLSEDSRVISDVFVKLSLKKTHCGRKKSIMGACECAERSSPLWVCIPQKSIAIARDFWNANSFGWTPFHTGFSIFWSHHQNGSSGAGWWPRLPGTYQGLSVKLQYLQCVSNRLTSGLH